MRQQLPGATVVAKGGGLQRTTVADRAGCYELTDLPPASYRVTARLTGFDNVTSDIVVVASSTSTRLEFTTRPSAICECIRMTGTLAELRDRSDAVLHVRLSESETAGSTAGGFYRHSAAVVGAVKQAAGPRPGTISLLQNQRSGSPDPYDAGQELVAFLQSSGPNAFRLMNDDPGPSAGDSVDPSMVFLVRGDRIQRAPPEFSRYIGTSVSSFLEELRTGAK